MANLIIAKDEAGKFATISDAWLTRFPGQFEKVRDVTDPITDEERQAEAEALEAEAKAEADARQAQLAALKEQDTAAAKTAPASTEAAPTESSSRSSRSSF